MSLQVNAVIPVGIGDGVITLIANDNGVRFLPPSAQVGSMPGGGGYFDVTVPASSPADAVALRLLGVPAADISAAMNYGS